MARNKGLIPSSPGEISIQRKQLKAIIESLLPACTEPDPETGLPFRAQAIIANPPAYGNFFACSIVFSILSQHLPRHHVFHAYIYMHAHIGNRCISDY